VEAVGTNCLILDTKYHLDLMDTFYIPSITRILISLSKLDVTGYSLSLGMVVSVCLSILVALDLVHFLMVYIN